MVPVGSTSIRVSYIGMQTQDVKLLKGKEYYKIVLEMDAESLSNWS